MKSISSGGWGELKWLDIGEMVCWLTGPPGDDYVGFMKAIVANYPRLEFCRISSSFFSSLFSHLKRCDKLDMSDGHEISLLLKAAPKLQKLGLITFISSGDLLTRFHEAIIDLPIAARVEHLRIGLYGTYNTFDQEAPLIFLERLLESFPALTSLRLKPGTIKLSTPQRMSRFCSIFRSLHDTLVELELDATWLECDMPIFTKFICDTIANAPKLAKIVISSNSDEFQKDFKQAVESRRVSNPDFWGFFKRLHDF